MCTPTENGYIMNDKITVTHKQILEGNISDKHYTELRGHPLDTVDGVHIRHNLHGIRNDLQKIMSPHYYEPVIDARIKSVSKRFIASVAKYSGYGSLIIGFLYAIYNIIA